jgi:hypothetical protein
MFSVAGLAQSTLSGRVTAVAGSNRTSAAGAWVVASSGSPLRTVASTQTDAEGAYRLEGLPEGRVEFTVSQRGYFTWEAGGSASATLARACPALGSCGEADFVIARAGVVEGYATDPFGDPFPNADVLLTKKGASAEANRRGPRAGFNRSLNTTDDRGYFRFYGVMPGEYELEIRPARLHGDIFFVDPVEVSVELGEPSPPLYIAMSVRAEPVHVGGAIDGLNLEGGEVVRILAANVGGGRNRRPFAGVQVDTEAEGAPRFSGQLMPGEYVLTAEILEDGSRLGGRAVTLGRYRIDGNATDLRLVARAGASFLGSIRFEDMEPRRTDLTLVPLDGGSPDTVRFGRSGRFQGPFGRSNGGRFGGNPTFERNALLPGRYRLEANSTDYFITSQTEFSLSEGEAFRTEIVISGAFGEIRGVVRPPSEDAGTGPFVVALRDESGKVIALQSAVEGQYSFLKLLPGDYQICAWADASVDPRSDQAWKAASSTVRSFSISAGDRVEILLTAKP